MKKVVCVFLSVILCIMMLFSGTLLASAASTEYIKTDKTEYKSGEMVKISYNFDTAESSRFICVYKDEAIYNNLMYAMSASSISNDGVWVPSSNVVWTWHGGGPSIMTKPLSAGTYIIKVMYLTGVSTNAPDYVEGAKSSIMATFTVVENTGSTNPTISATKTELEAGENIEIAFDGVTNKLGSNTLSIELKNSVGTLIKTWNLWDGSAEYAGLNGKVSYTGDLSADTYTATLVCSDAEVTLGDTQVQVTVKESMPVVGSIATDKAEYKSGEMVKISYDLDVAEDARFICVYKDEAIYNNLMYAMSASSISNDGVWVPSSNVVWTWHGGGPSIMTKPLSAGTYIIKVMYLTGVSTNAPDYVEGAKSSIMATFTVVENTGSTNPTISATKTELEAGEDLEIAFDGVTNKLGGNTLQIELKNSAGTVVKTWSLWDGSAEYAGLNGKVSYTGDLSADTYMATLVCSDAEVTLGDTQIQFVVKAQANTPTGATAIEMISLLLLFGTVAYFMMKKRCTR